MSVTWLDAITAEQSFNGNWWWTCGQCDATGWAYEQWGAEVAGREHLIERHELDAFA